MDWITIILSVLVILMLLGLILKIIFGIINMEETSGKIKKTLAWIFVFSLIVFLIYISIQLYNLYMVSPMLCVTILVFLIFIMIIVYKVIDEGYLGNEPWNTYDDSYDTKRNLKRIADALEKQGKN